MSILKLISDESVRAKEKASMLSEMIAEKPAIIPEIIDCAKVLKDSDKAIVLEAFEYISKNNHGLIEKEVLDFASNNLESKASRVKWESAKVIGNTISQFPEKAEEVAPLLLSNTDDDSTVVRWSMAFALSEILKLRLSINKELIPSVTEIMEKEGKASIKKIYSRALKKIKLWNPLIRL